ncbi:hypothetical protein FGQ54_18390 [Acinetobacter lwoffii]|nr:hypothetical protein F980_02064 [Acinetobacter lwoffii NIPH 715]ENX19800.1 hypothetical protein F893_02552 [Acinetobacter sp. CIP 102136]TMS40590.1 hypothetical protein FGQ54_18390 [Acinetobacter lwoffii]
MPFLLPENSPQNINHPISYKKSRAIALPFQSDQDLLLQDDQWIIFFGYKSASLLATVDAFAQYAGYSMDA